MGGAVGVPRGPARYQWVVPPMFQFIQFVVDLLATQIRLPLWSVERVRTLKIQKTRKPSSIGKKQNETSKPRKLLDSIYHTPIAKKQNLQTLGTKAPLTVCSLGGPARASPDPSNYIQIHPDPSRSI